MTIRAALIAMVSLLVALPALAQEMPPASPEAQEWLNEMQAIQGQLQPLQEEALADPELQAAHQDLTQRVEEVMAEIDPQVPQYVQRFEEIQQEAVAAQAAGDQERLMALTAEAEEIQGPYLDAHAQALQHPEIAADAEAFQARLQAQVIQLEPAAAELYERYEDLERRVAEAAGVPSL